MMHPKYEQLRMIGEAMRAAVEEFDTPIDRVEVDRSLVHVWSQGRRVTLTCGYANAYSDRGDVMPGSGSWWAQITKPGDKPPSLWDRLRGKGGKPS